MPKTVVWLIILATALFAVGINAGKVTYLMNLGHTICLSCIGVG